MSGESAVPAPSSVPSPADCHRGEPGRNADTVTGTVVWHREHLRTADHAAIAAAAGRSDVICPLFVFDPSFYGDDGLACDARIVFLHECLSSLNDQYLTATGGDSGLTYAHGDPLTVLERFVDAGWDVVAARTPTARYGKRRDERAVERCDVEFVTGDGLVRDTERPREDWQHHVESWFDAEPYDWDPRTVETDDVDTPVAPADIENRYDVTPEKSYRPTGGRTAAQRTLDEFVRRLSEYPENVSSPLDARGGTSGLSPYLRFGVLSLREVYQTVIERAPETRGRDMFVSRLFWNRHYQQKLEDWSGWTDTAVNPVFQGFNAGNYDPEYVEAWKHGRTGYPMVDAAARCLRDSGWLNFRMRAMLASFYFHVLQQPWQIGADWFHYHLVDSEAGINYTQWQSQCGLIGKPSQMVYNPRKQVRDHDPEGEWITEWVPELADFPATFLDQPEKAPRDRQQECGVVIGEQYPYPIVEYEAAIERFWDRYEARKPRAAARLGDPEIARRASLSGGIEAARSIAKSHGTNPDDGETTTRTELSAFTE